MTTMELLVLIIAIAQSLMVLGVLVAMFYAIRTIGKIARQAQPTLDEARRTIDNINRIAGNVGSRVEDIASTSDHMVHNVSKKVERTTTLLKDVIEGPLIQLASVSAGISGGYSAWKRWSSKMKGGNGIGEGI